MPQVDGADDSGASTSDEDAEPREKKGKRTKGQAVKVSWFYYLAGYLYAFTNVKIICLSELKGAA